MYNLVNHSPNTNVLFYVYFYVSVALRGNNMTYVPKIFWALPLKDYYLRPAIHFTNHYTVTLVIDIFVLMQP